MNTSLHSDSIGIIAQLSRFFEGFGVFFHFGIRAFFKGSRDWDGIPMPVETFNPESLDCDSWIDAARPAGARYAILTCKHHDGFANWPTAYSDYSVASSPYKGGKGDVVREFVEEPDFEAGTVTVHLIEGMRTDAN